MRVIIAECSVEYSGRGSTTLERATRALIWKRDGSIAVHSDASNKPLNYMDGKKMVHNITEDSQGNPLWIFEARNESIAVTMYNIITDSEHELEEEEPGLQRDGTEAHLQEWLSHNIQTLDPDLLFIQREYHTGTGYVDLLCERKSTGALVAVEVKRVALLGVVYQTVRYVDAIEGNQQEGIDVRPVEGLIAAVDIRPRTRILAEKKGIPFLEIPENWRNQH